MLQNIKYEEDLKMTLRLLWELQLPEHRFLLVVFQLLKNAVKTLFVRDGE